MSDDIAAANKQLVRRFYKEVYGDWNMAMVGEVVSPRFTSHDWPEAGPKGSEGFALFYSAIRTALPDARYEVDDLIAEGDKVVVRWRLLGTHLGDFRGMAPTGRAITLEGIAIYRLDGGKLVERWVVTNLYDVISHTDAAASSPNSLQSV